MTVVALVDGVVAIEGDVKAGRAPELYSLQKVDCDLAEDSMVEEAARLKKHLKAPLVVLSFAPAAFEKEMRSYLAAGGDRAIRVECDFGAALDPVLKAKLVHEVLCAQVPDWTILMMIDRTPGGAAGVLHHCMAELAGVPAFSAVVAVQPDAEGLEVVSRSAGLIRRYRCDSRAILGVSSRVAARNPSFMDVHRSRKATIEVVDASAWPARDALHARQAIAAYGAVRHPEASQGGGTTVHKLSTDETAERIAALCEAFIESA
ncbi:Electron transfer flavoprotein, beta subunit [Variovorax sp. SRS16]|uniref:hypothetical protein n=1 Tax=Variovorax sp. SRS16 TaxID=282217 RepID=UPI00131795F9|nr:hypothetical protein [Variovorax sp. SRS16]VTU16861.1 Electron transfer flavoprotein, beta subunit [Variovorax sp. SRS16]